MDSLLDKYPEQLSGGERQRISVVRAILNHPTLLLADEPTASLDDENSAFVARTIAALRNENRIIIVTAHERCFDSYADEIIWLNYGEIGEVEKCEPVLPRIAEEENDEIKASSRKFDIFLFILQRGKKRFSVLSLFPMIAAFFLVALISTVQNNFESEYYRMLGERYPLDMVTFNPSEYEIFPYRDRLTIYRNYIARDGEIAAYYLPPKSASIFCIEGMLDYGEFPQNESEILASHEYIAAVFGSEVESASCIGKTVSFKGEEFRISGIVTDYNAVQEKTIHFNNDPYYHINLRNRDKIVIYITYDMLCRIGDEQRVKEGYFVTSYPGLLRDTEAYEALCACMMQGKPNPYYGQISGVQKSIDDITGIFVLVLGVCFLISCVFLVSVISSDLYYRRKELGYLQLFGVPKKKVIFLSTAEYLVKLLLSHFGAASSMPRRCLFTGSCLAAPFCVILFSRRGLFLQ